VSDEDAFPVLHGPPLPAPEVEYSEVEAHVLVHVGVPVLVLVRLAAVLIRGFSVEYPHVGGSVAAVEADDRSEGVVRPDAFGG